MKRQLLPRERERQEVRKASNITNQIDKTGWNYIIKEGCSTNAKIVGSLFGEGVEWERRSCGEGMDSSVGDVWTTKEELEENGRESCADA